MYTHLYDQEIQSNRKCNFLDIWNPRFLESEVHLQLLCIL